MYVSAVYIDMNYNRIYFFIELFAKLFTDFLTCEF